MNPNYFKIMLVACVAALAIVFAASFFSPTKAVAGPLTRPVDWQTTCATAATVIAPTGAGVSSFTCYNKSATSVFLGGADVDTTGYCISTTGSTCHNDELAADIRHGVAYCRVASGTVVISCFGAQ